MRILDTSFVSIIALLSSFNLSPHMIPILFDHSSTIQRYFSVFKIVSAYFLYFCNNTQAIYIVSGWIILFYSLI